MPNTPATDSQDRSNAANEKGPALAAFFMNVILATWLFGIIVSLIVASQAKTIPYSEFITDIKQGKVQDLVVTDKQISGAFVNDKGNGQRFTTYRVDPGLADVLTGHGIKFSAPQPENWLANVVTWVVSIAVFMMLLGRFSPSGRGSDGIAAPFLPIERSRARIVPEDKIKTKFADVAGVDEAIAELQEIVGFLKEPSKYNKLGGRLPKGILLVGPPGTGKTLLARAVAGEAGVPFFCISGSEFVELFVGVGAARVRDLFSQARAKAPCIIFIDELDALGRSRAASPMLGGHDEKEQTLNQLLVELDGFDPSTGIILLAATNRPEILDQALLRAGRFDRHVLIDRPDKRGREAILHVHAKKLQMSAEVDLAKLAAATPGFTGADLENVVNEAALLAARRKASQVEPGDFDEAIERTIAGLEKKDRILTAKERKVVAYHEMGHALVGMCLPGVERVEKVSIVPRGIAALGFTMQLPAEDRFILNSSELKNKLASMLGGRAAEVLVFGDTSTGSADDTEKATELARAMVTRYGMDPQLGLAAYEREPGFLNQPFAMADSGRAISSETAREIECAIRSLLDEAYMRARDTLMENRDWLEVCAQQLLHDEVLTAERIRQLKPQQALEPPMCVVMAGEYA